MRGLSYSKIKSLAAFTLVELIIVIAIISILAAIVVITIDPSKLFANTRNTQRAQDISTYQSAIVRYVAESSTASLSRTLSDLHGYNNLIAGAAGGLYICPGGSSNPSSLSSITSYYSIDNIGTNILDVSILISNGYLYKVIRDPLTNQSYRVCIDNLNNSQLVIYSPIAENTTNIPLITLNFPTSNLGISNGLVDYYPIDEASGTVVTDKSNITKSGSATGTTISAGKYNNSRSFNGTSSDYITIPHVINVSSTAFTFSSWVNPTNTTFGPIIEDWNSTGGSYAFQFFLQSGKISLQLRNSSSMDIFPGGLSSVGTINTWSNVTGTWDPKTSIGNVYINGILAASATGISNSVNNTSNNFGIGIKQDSSSTFSGKIDEVRIYNRALSDSEIAQLYSWGAPPVAYQSFDEGAGTTASDSSTNGQTATWNGTGSPHWLSGKFGSSGSFNGSNDYLDTSTSPTTNVSTFTMSAWVKPAVLPQPMSSFIAYNGTDAGGYGFSIGNIYDQPGTRLWALFGGSAWIDSGYNFPTANIWYHVVMTRDGTTTLFYVNGVQTSGTSAAVPVSNSSAHYTIGGVSAQTRYFQGQIDEVKLYNYARTQTQIIADMN